MKKNTIMIRVHPDFKEYINNIRKKWEEAMGCDITSPQATKIILKKLREVKIKKDLSKLKTLKKRRKEMDYFEKPF